MCTKPMDSRTVAYLQKQQQLTMNSKAIIEPFKTSASTINQIKDALNQIDCVSKAPGINRSRTSKY